MGIAKNSIIFFLLYPLLVDLAAASNCPSSFECGNLGTLEFPLSDRQGCGLFMIRDCTFSDSQYPSIQFGADGRWYTILQILAKNRFLISDPLLYEYIVMHSCLDVLRNVYLPLQSPSTSFVVSPNLTLFTCHNRSFNEPLHSYFKDYHHTNCSQLDLYYRNSATTGYVPVTDIPPNCSMIQVPTNSTRHFSGDLFSVLSPLYAVEWNVSEDCYECHHGGGKCLTNNLNGFHCSRGIINAANINESLDVFLELPEIKVWVGFTRINPYDLKSEDGRPVDRNRIRKGQLKERNKHRWLVKEPKDSQ